MCMGGGGGGSSAPPPAPPPPAPAPPAPAVIMATAADSSQTDSAKIARQKGRSALRIDQTSGVSPTTGVVGGLNIPN